MDLAYGTMGSHPLRREAPIHEEHDCCEWRHLFGIDVTIRKGCLNPYIKLLPPIIVHYTKRYKSARQECYV